MKIKLITIAIVFIIEVACCFANPYEIPNIKEFSVNPPWVEVEELGYPEAVIGTYLTTMYCQAVILAFEPGPYTGLLDSSTTTGFILNAAGDSVILDEIAAPVGFGLYGGKAGSPPDGISMVSGLYPTWFVYPDTLETMGIAYDFCLTPSPAIENGNYYAGGHWGTSDLIINEISINCDWRAEADFIEFYNGGSTPVNTDNILLIGHAVFHFPDGLIIDPDEYYVIDENQLPAGFTSNPDGDVVYLVIENSNYPGGNQYAVVDQAGWSTDHGTNISFMRYPDGDVDSTMFMEDFQGFNDETSLTFENGFPSRGAPNRHENPGFVVIGAKAKLVDESNILVKWTDPVWDDDFEQAVLVRNVNHYPETYGDGEIIYQGTEQMFIDQTAGLSEAAFYTVFARNTDQEYSIPTHESKTGIGFNAYLPGDVNMYSESWPPAVIGGDVTYLVNYFRGTPSAQECLLNGFWGSADANGDCIVIGSDVTKLVNYFRGQGSVGFCPAYTPLWFDVNYLPAEAPLGWPNCE